MAKRGNNKPFTRDTKGAIGADNIINRLNKRLIARVERFGEDDIYYNEMITEIIASGAELDYNKKGILVVKRNKSNLNNPFALKDLNRILTDKHFKTVGESTGEALTALQNIDPTRVYSMADVVNYMKRAAKARSEFDDAMSYMYNEAVDLQDIMDELDRRRQANIITQDEYNVLVSNAGLAIAGRKGKVSDWKNRTARYDKTNKIIKGEDSI